MKFEETPDLILDARKNYLIYFLLLGGDVVYVGQTTQNMLRPFAHKDKIFDSVAIIYQSEDKEELNANEEFYIKKYSPKYNRVFNPDGYANGVITECYEIEKLKELTQYCMTMKELNKKLGLENVPVLTKREFKNLKKYGFKFYEGLIVLDPKSYLRLIKSRLVPKRKRMKAYSSFSETVDRIVLELHGKLDE